MSVTTKRSRKGVIMTRVVHVPISELYFCLNFEAQSNPENHVTPKSLTCYRKLVIQGHLTLSRYQFIPNSYFSGRIISFFKIFSYLRYVKQAILKRS